jgi:hypothetical protein
MPLAIRWSHFTKDNLSRETDNFGVYELGNDDDILYIGEGQVYTRLMSHFSTGSQPVVGASYYRVEYTGSKLRATQRQNAELGSYKRKYGRYPPFNQRKG